METDLKAKEIHEYYMGFFKDLLKTNNCTISKQKQKEMVREVEFMIDTS